MSVPLERAFRHLLAYAMLFLVCLDSHPSGGWKTAGDYFLRPNKTAKIATTTTPAHHRAPGEVRSSIKMDCRVMGVLPCLFADRRRIFDRRVGQLHGRGQAAAAAGDPAPCNSPRDSAKAK